VVALCVGMAIGLGFGDSEEERHVVFDTFEHIEKATGTRPKGWLSSGLQESWQTLDYLAEAGAS
jgi:peptidoglycan/xylan/chitin deacetylase (PgdA/CDA1 family)